MTVPEVRCPACFALVVPRTACGCGYDAAAAVSFLTLPPGTVLRAATGPTEYHVGLELGAGGFGITYLGWHPGRKERVAIKEYLPRDRAGRATNGTSVRPHSTDDAALFQHGLSRFLQEAEALSQFDHPNVVRVLDFFRTNGTAYLVMPYCEGHTLGEHLDELRKRSKGDPQVVPRLSPEVAVDVMLGVLDGLAHVHGRTMEGRRWMHRDVKPGNILLRRDASALLIDFGAARAEVGEKSESLSVVLTPGYAPPEQYFPGGKTQGPWVDVYGCAATLYHALTGEAPVGALERYDAIRRGERDPLKRPNELVREVSPDLSNAVLQGMAIDYRHRPQDAGQYRDAIRSVPRRSAVPPPPPPEPPGPRPDPPDPPDPPHPIVRTLVLGALVFAAAAGGTYVTWRTMPCYGAAERWSGIDKSESRRLADYQSFLDSLATCAGSGVERVNRAARLRMAEIDRWEALDKNSLAAVEQFLKTDRGVLFAPDARVLAAQLVEPRERDAQRAREAIPPEASSSAEFPRGIEALERGKALLERGEYGAADRAYAEARKLFLSSCERVVKARRDAARTWRDSVHGPATATASFAAADAALRAGDDSLEKGGCLDALRAYTQARESFVRLSRGDEEAPGPGLITISLRNACDRRIRVAMGYVAPDGTRMRKGWWLLEPAEERVAVSSPSPQVYFYGEDLLPEGSPGRWTWDGSRYEGSISREVRAEEFDIEEGATLDGDGLRTVSFFPQVVASASYREVSFTQRFTCPGGGLFNR